MSQPLTLSVLVPVFNERFLVAESLRRVLEFEHPAVGALDVVVVDDGSTDGSAELVARLAEQHPQIRFFPQARNRGKGAALRVAIAEARGDLSVVHDADLEYDPRDWAKLLEPFLEADADAVYGSRFAASEYRRVLYFRHTLGNRFLTALSNLMTDLNLTDMETCYKMVRTSLLQSIPLRSDQFGVEPELTAKLAKRGAVIYEVPIRYKGRTYREGKKIDWTHGAAAIGQILRWRLEDDLFVDDQRGADLQITLSRVRRINEWMSSVFLEHVGSSVLELGAGVGTITNQLLPRERYLATDVSEHYLRYLENMAVQRQNMEVQRLDPADSDAFDLLAGQFDTVVCLNVVEHLDGVPAALRNIATALAPGGKAVVAVPQGAWLFSSLDRILGHRQRYARAELEGLLADAGLELVQLRDFNRIGVLGWAVNGKLMKRERISKLQLKLLNTALPAVAPLDEALPWHGLSLVAVARKPVE